MDETTPRRLFLKNTFKAGAGIAVITSIAPFTAQATDKSPYEGYNPFADAKVDLRTSLFGKQVVVKGKVYDRQGTFPKENTTVEVWHLSPNSKKYRHRAKLRTNAEGEYRFTTDFPNRKGKKMPRIFFKVSDDGKTTFTELIFTDFGPHITADHWERHHQLGDELLFPKFANKNDVITINFNITTN